MNEIIYDYFASLTTEDLEQAVDDIYEAMTDGKTVEQMQAIQERLLQLGVDVRPICKRKHPA